MSLTLLDAAMGVTRATRTACAPTTRCAVAATAPPRVRVVRRAAHLSSCPSHTEPHSVGQRTDGEGLPRRGGPGACRQEQAARPERRSQGEDQARHGAARYDMLSSLAWLALLSDARRRANQVGVITDQHSVQARAQRARRRVTPAADRRRGCGGGERCVDDGHHVAGRAGETGAHAAQPGRDGRGAGWVQCGFGAGTV